MILFIPPQKETESPLYLLAKQLHREYSYVFLEEIPSSLPPQRAIQHYIDLIPRPILSNKLAYRMAIIPNKPAYRVNPKTLWKSKDKYKNSCLGFSA